MHRKSKWIICLLAIAVSLFCIIEFYAIPEKQADMDKYEERQADALTHDITSIDTYKNHYLGDAPNTTGLINALPLYDISKTFEIKDSALIVNYQASTGEIGKDKVRRDLVYNAIAAMGCIDALDNITFIFSDDEYAFSREEATKICEEAFGNGNLTKLLIQGTWEKTVQQKIKEPDFARRFSAFADFHDKKSQISTSTPYSVSQ